MTTSTQEQHQSTDAHTKQAQSEVTKSRFLGYIGTQLSGVLIPALIFQISNSLKLAGLAILIEWLPKLAMYLSGGSLIKKMGSAKTHMTLDLARLVALFALLLAAMGQVGIVFIVAAAAIYQSCNAVSNILFETSITKWWESEDRIHGHSFLMKMDQMGSLLGLAIGYLAGSAVMMCAIAMLFQSITLFRTVRFGNRIHAVKAMQEEPGARDSSDDFWPMLRRNLKTALQPCFLKVVFVSVCVGLPSAVLLCFLAFHLQRVDPSLTDASSSMSIVHFVRCAMIILVLQFLHMLCKKGDRIEKHLVPIGLFLMITGELAVMQASSVNMMVIAIAYFGINGCFLSPWIRSTRQKLIEEKARPEDQASITGLLIAMDAITYLLVGLIGYAMDLKVAMQCAFAASCVGALTMFFMAKNRAEEHSSNPYQNA